jgi:hypothetical protein
MPAMATLDAPTRILGARTTEAPRGARHRSGRAMIAIAALVLGIGSCQLLQPHLPTLQMAAVGASASTLAHVDRT